MVMVTKTGNQQFEFKDEHEIGRAAVSKWKDVYNKNHGRANTNILQENISLCLHIS